MQKISKKNIGKVLGICIVGILLCTTMIPISESNNDILSVMPQTNYVEYVYDNATLLILSMLYCVQSYEEDFIELYNCRLFPFGIWYIANESGIQQFNRVGGWMNSIVEIYNFEGFFKWRGLWIVIIGECDKIIITTYRQKN